ncbi:MAG: extracellular solute-binding protein [Desulfobacterales bacterium]
MRRFRACGSLRALVWSVALMLIWMAVAGCSEDPRTGSADTAQTDCDLPPVAPSDEPIPTDLVWLTNDTDPVFAAPETQKGGTFHEALGTFPLTFRVVGPDSNTSFRSAILGNQLSLVGIHPNTLNIIPELATHWAYGTDRKTMFFKLNPAARWSDGVPVTAGDFAYTLEFMRSKFIVAPWYNDYYSQEIDRVIVYDDHTLAVVSTKAQPDLHLKVGISPTPRHFFCRLDDGFIRRYNWAIVPNTGPYQISDFRKGKRVVFERKKEWWARDLKYFRNRFNVDKVIYTVVRNPNLQWEYFKKAKIDAFSLTVPQFWHIKSRIPEVEKGYIEKIWFFNDTPQSAQGLWLNQDREIFKDPNVRYAFAHAMNVERVIQKVLRNDYVRLESAYVGYGPYTNPDIRARRFDLGKVASYMQSSGWDRGSDGIWGKNGRRFEVEVVYSREEHTPRLVVLREEAKKAGIVLNLQRLDPSAAFKKVLEKRHDVAWVAWSTSLRPHFWEFWHSANAHKPQTNNITNTDDPELDRMIDTYRNSLDEEERITLSRQIQERVHEIGAFVPTFMVPYFREAYWRWWRFPKPPATRSSESLFSPFDSGTGGLFWYDGERHRETREAMTEGKSFPSVTRIEETYKP